VSGIAVRDRAPSLSVAAPSRAAAVTPAHVVYTAAALWGAAFAGLATLRHLAFHTARFDLGNMVQAVWSTAHGRFLETTGGNGGQFSRLGAHFDPVLAFLAPLWWVWPSPLLLLVVQALAVSAGAIPVFWLARKHLPSTTTAVWFAVAYLLYAPVQWLTVDDFHPIALAVPFLLFALWYLDEDRLGVFAIWALLASLTGEEVPALVAFLGLWYALRRRRVLHGVLIAAVGLAASFIAFYVIVPALSPGVGIFPSRYGDFGGSPGGVASAVVHRPLDVVAALSSSRDLSYVLFLAVPWACLFLLEPILAAGAVPMLFLNLVSSVPNQSTISFHYTAPIVPFLVAASVLGAARLPRARCRSAGLAVLALMTLGLILSPGHLLVRYAGELGASDNATARAALDLIPAGAPVTTSNHLGAYLSARRSVFAFPLVGDAEWAAIDSDDGFLRDEYAPDRFRTYVARLRRDPHWRLVFERDGVFVMHRVSAGGPVRLDRTTR
jgi:uncharacterized membrane protein